MQLEALPAPPEKFPNSTIPAGGGLNLTPPTRKALEIQSIYVRTIANSRQPRRQGHTSFRRLQGAHYTIAVDGVGSFPISRGQIHTVSFTADKVGIINYSSPD